MQSIKKWGILIDSKLSCNLFVLKYVRVFCWIKIKWANCYATRELKMSPAFCFLHCWKLWSTKRSYIFILSRCFLHIMPDFWNASTLCHVALSLDIHYVHATHNMPCFLTKKKLICCIIVYVCLPHVASTSQNIAHFHFTVTRVT